jgi:NAD(P)H-dependent FMN reductase
METQAEARPTAGHPQDSPLRLTVIIGSIREGRTGASIGRWFAARAGERGDVLLDVVDLAEAALPTVFGPTRSPEAAAFAARIAAADAYAVITPEYNHGYPAALKNAIDTCYTEWHAKPVGFVSYGGIAGGLRAVEQLRQVFGELHVAAIRDTVSFVLGPGLLDADGELAASPEHEKAATLMLDRLVWWGRALRQARLTSPYAL